MPSDERRPQSRRSSANKREVQQPYPRTDQMRRNPRTGERPSYYGDSTSYNTDEDEDIFGEDSDIAFAYDPPRKHSSSIRMSPVTGQQASPRKATQGARTTGNAGRRNGSVIKPYPGPMQARSNRTVDADSYEIPSQHPPRRKYHFLLPLGVSMLALIALWVIASLALAWGTQRYNDIRYGTPRTAQYDEVVGHNDSPAHPSHFIAMNLNRHVVIVEFVGGDPAKSFSYTGPYLFGPGGDLTPVTLEFRDVNRDHLPDMIIHMQDQTTIFINTGTKFRLATDSDHINP